MPLNTALDLLQTIAGVIIVAACVVIGLSLFLVRRYLLIPEVRHTFTALCGLFVVGGLSHALYVVVIWHPSVKGVYTVAFTLTAALALVVWRALHVLILGAPRNLTHLAATFQHWITTNLLRDANERRVK